MCYRRPALAQSCGQKAAGGEANPCAALGRLATRTDAAGAWAWTYDGDTGRVLTVTDPDDNVVSYDYDAVGQRGTMALTAAGQQQQLMELDYTPGLDLSQTLGGAGGVGGLLSITRPSSLDPRPSPLSLFVSYDGNGNVVALADAATGTVAAQYDYSPFGETVKATGPAADANPFRFSTKYADGPSPGPELYYYGSRYYNPGLARWSSRDPAEEEGGTNLYSFVENEVPGHFDATGLASCCCRCAINISVAWHSVFRALPAWNANYYIDFRPTFNTEYTSGATAGARKCRMTWFERWDDHNLTGSFSPEKGKWEQWETFQNRFDKHRPKCPGTVSQTIKDRPGLYYAGLKPYMANQTRYSHMTFSITLYSAAECECPYRMIVLRSTLRMRYDGVTRTRDAGYEYFRHDIYKY